MGKREESKERNRSEILKAAQKVFLEKGYHSASVADIINGTDLARGTFYLYFKDKSEVFRSMMSRLYELMQKFIENLETTGFTDNAEILLLLKKTTIQFFLILQRNRDLVQIVLLTPFGYDSKFDKDIEKYNNLLINNIAKMLQKANDRNQIKANPEIYARLIYGGIKELAMYSLKYRNLEPLSDNEADEVVKFFAFGFIRKP